MLLWRVKLNRPTGGRSAPTQTKSKMSSESKRLITLTPKAQALLYTYSSGFHGALESFYLGLELRGLPVLDLASKIESVRPPKVSTTQTKSKMPPNVKNTWTEADGSVVVILRGFCHTCADYVEYREGTEEVCANCETPEDEVESYVCYDCCLNTNQSPEERDKYNPLCESCWIKAEALTTHTCDHCDTSVTSYWPSGSDDLLCADCFAKYTRDQGDSEDWEDYKTRHPYYVGAELDYDPLQSTKVFLASVKQHVPELLDACMDNIKLLQQQSREAVARQEKNLVLMQEILDHLTQ